MKTWFKDVTGLPEKIARFVYRYAIVLIVGIASFAYTTQSAQFEKMLFQAAFVWAVSMLLAGLTSEVYGRVSGGRKVTDTQEIKLREIRASVFTWVFVGNCILWSYSFYTAFSS